MCGGTSAWVITSVGPTSVRLVLIISLLLTPFLVVLPGTGAARADTGEVEVEATSPPYARVVVVPDAVSVTFTGEIHPGGAQISVSGPGGLELGDRTEVVGDTLREYLQPGPAGAYTVAWSATGAGGEKLSGSFSFDADQAHADYVPAAGPTAAAVVPHDQVPTRRDDSLEVPRIVVPIGMAALLVAASGLIAAANRRRPHRPA